MSNNELQTNTNLVSNSNISVLVTKEPGLQVTLTITVGKEATEAAYAKAVKAVKKEVSLPGFRKGKAPDATILHNYAPQLEQEWREAILQTAYKEALELTNLYPFNREKIRADVRSMSHEDGAEVVLSFEAAPQVPKIDVKAIRLKPVTRAPISQSDVDKVLENVRMSRIEWEEILDRAVEEGDYVDIDIDNLDLPGVVICKDARFKVVEGEMGAWMRKLLIGLSAGQSVEGISEKPEHKGHADAEECHDESCESHSHSHAKGAESNFIPTRCRITVKSHKKGNLPELTDELAQIVGLPSVAVLHERIWSDLEANAVRQVKEALEAQVEDFLLANYDFEIPASQVDLSTNSYLLKEKARIAASNLAAEVIEEQLAKATEQCERELNAIYRRFYLLTSLAQEQQIKVSEEDLMAELNEQISSKRLAKMMEGGAMDPSKMRQHLENIIIMRKVKEYIVQHAQIDAS